MAVSGGVVEAFGSGAPKITMGVAAAITAGRLVEINGARTVQMAAAASQKVVGVACQTSDGTSTDKITVATGGVWALIASGTVTAGDAVIAAANGQVATVPVVTTPTAADVNNTRALVGVALTTATNGNPVYVLLQKVGG
jgi:Uncharacterized conserved protein (DUF2190)